MLIYAQEGGLGNSGGGVVDVDFFLNQGVIYTGYRPCFIWYRGDLYCIGYYSRPVVRHAGDGGWRLAGIRAPQMELSVSPGGGSGGSSGACLAYITFLHKKGGMVLAESNPSNVVDVGMLSGEGRTWANIDNQTAELRVTHVRGYISMEGTEFRAAWEAQYGVTGYAENIRTSQLTYTGPGFTNHIPPATRFGHSWAGRMWYANNPQYPYRIWYSKAGYPQYVKPSSFRDTLDRETITAIWKGRNELLVFCDRSTYMIRQFGQGDDDFIMEKLDSDVGCISHFGIQEIHNKLWFPSEDGVWIYDGSFRYLMKEMQPLWKADWESNRDDFRAGFALHDRINKVYMWVTNRPARAEFENTGLSPGTVVYAGYYGDFEPSMAGEQAHPEWTLDFKDRFDSCGFYNEAGELVIGSCDGVIRVQDWTDPDDDGDSLQKELIIRTGLWLFNEPGDDRESGKQIHQIWEYVESESTAWSLYVRGGDEQAWRSVLPDNELAFWKIDVAASGLTEQRTLKARDSSETTYTITYVPQTTHYFVPQKVTGRGFVFETRAVAPVDFNYRGLGGMWGPGSTQRGIETAVFHTAFQMTLEWATDLGGPWTPIATGTQTLAIVDAGPTLQLYYRLTPSYSVGSPSYPITVTFDHQTQPGYDQTVQIVDVSSPVIVTVPAPYAVPSSGQYLILTVDNAGVPCDDDWDLTVTLATP